MESSSRNNCCSVEDDEKHRTAKDELIIASKPANFTGLVTEDHYRILYPALQKGNIRLLEILKPETTKPGVGAPIVCRLWVHTIVPQPGKAATEHWPGYEALSYVWAQQPRDRGKTGKKAIITVINAHDPSVEAKFIIGWNLHEALKFFRREDGSRIMWTDQICINQQKEEDNPRKDNQKQGEEVEESEKMQQVDMMKTINERARQVQVWLGPSIPESKVAAEYFAPFDGRPVTNEELMQSYRSARTQWEDLYDGFQNRPWWSRAWIVQEVIRRINPVLNSGPDSISFNLFLRVIKFAQKSGINLSTRRSLINGTTKFPVIDMVYMRDQLKLGQMPYLSEWLTHFHNQSATNPKDRIFAYLSLSDRALAWPRQTSYRNDIEDVWAEGTKLALYQSNSYDFICHGRGWDWGVPGEKRDYVPPNPEDRDRTEEGLNVPLKLPSWVPNFRADDGNGLTSARLLPLRYYPNESSEYNACGNLQTISHTKGWKELEVLGVLVDKIKIVSKINFSFMEGVEPDAFQNEALKLCYESLSSCSITCSSANCTHYPSPRGGSCVLAFWKTMVMDLDSNGRRLQANEGYHTLPQQYNTPPDSFQPAVTNTKKRRDLWNKQLLDDKSKWTNWRRFIITEKGYFGMAHWHSIVGDSIYVVGGATIPFVLREDNPSTFEEDRKLKFVGESYVHCFMDDEITDGMESKEIGRRLVLV
ncbi:heterokaryon incompatibility protein-domain-containing protein [Paraphoma chrysanthemicola]|nr:heterokaryon incompatibility protein-domain-containing protein [Paraphoma chrysanthemicola]